MARTNHNILSNNKQSEDFMERERAMNLTPIGREIMNTHKKVRVDSKTVILKKIA